MNKPVFAKGSCRCGDITLEISSKPKMMMQCHCKDCQKASGTGHFSLAFFDENDVVINGQARGYTVTTDRGNRSTRYFCPQCGSRLYHKNTGKPGLTTVPVGCLDDHRWYVPSAVVFTKHRNEWDITRTDIPNFEEMPPLP